MAANPQRMDPQVSILRSAEMAGVEFTRDNAMKCMCGKCPVQAQSACVAEKSAKLKMAMESGMDGMPAVVDVPGLYCANGVAACTDLDFSQRCICSGCLVYKENRLGQWKYCERGSAADVG
jgi:hypothetical protein